MSPTAITRLALIGCLAVAPLRASQIQPPAYTHVGELPDRVDGQPFRTFIFDRTAHRLYLGSDRGLFFSDLGDADLHVTGPLVRKDITRIDVAPDLGRVFYTTAEEVGYVDVAGNGAPVVLARDLLPLDMVYESTRQEVYVATRAPVVRVFDAKSGEEGSAIRIPGWWALELEAIPGRVFMSLGGQDGLYAIDAATHVAAAFPVKGRVITPATIEADPDGRYLFLAFYREIVAIDVASAAVVGHMVTPTVPRIAYDPGTDVLIATWDDDPPPTRVVALAVEGGELRELGRYRNPAIGRTGVEPTSFGFIQAGVRKLLVWRAPGASSGSHGTARR
ncbi:MAG: hypothetical protein R2752_11860 [Vicinamibacterales bacterium]